MSKTTTKEMISIITSHSISGQSIARLGHGTQYVNVSVVNDGVLPLSAVLAVTLTEPLTQHNTMTIYSNTQILQTGSMLNPAAAQELSASFFLYWDERSMVNETEVIYNGTVYTNRVIEQHYNRIF